LSKNKKLNTKYPIRKYKIFEYSVDKENLNRNLIKNTKLNHLINKIYFLWKEYNIYLKTIKNDHSPPHTDG